MFYRFSGHVEEFHILQLSIVYFSIRSVHVIMSLKKLKLTAFSIFQICIDFPHLAVS